MEFLAIFLFIAGVVGLPIVLLLVNNYGSKRGCGRGCSTCGNRDICYRNRQSAQASKRNRTPHNM